MPATVPMISPSFGFSLSNPSQYSSALGNWSVSVHIRVISLRVWSLVDASSTRFVQTEIPVLLSAFLAASSSLLASARSFLSSSSLGCALIQVRKCWAAWSASSGDVREQNWVSTHLNDDEQV